MNKLFFVFIPDAIRSGRYVPFFVVHDVSDLSEVHVRSVCPKKASTESFDYVSIDNQFFVVLKNGGTIDRAIRYLKALVTSSLKTKSFSCGKNELPDDWNAMEDEKCRIDYYSDFDNGPWFRRTANPFDWDPNDEMSQSRINEGGRMTEMALGMSNVDRDAAEAELKYRSKVHSMPEYDGDNDDYRDLFNFNDAQ